MGRHKSTVSSETLGKAWSFTSSIGKRIKTLFKGHTTIWHGTQNSCARATWLGGVPRVTEALPRCCVESPSAAPPGADLTWRSPFPVPASSTHFVSSWSDLTSWDNAFTYPDWASFRFLRVRLAKPGCGHTSPAALASQLNWSCFQLVPWEGRLLASATSGPSALSQHGISELLHLMGRPGQVKPAKAASPLDGRPETVKPCLSSYCRPPTHDQQYLVPEKGQFTSQATGGKCPVDLAHSMYISSFGGY